MLLDYSNSMLMHCNNTQVLDHNLKIPYIAPNCVSDKSQITKAKPRST